MLYIEQSNADGWVDYMLELLCFVIGHMNFYASREYVVDGVTTPVLVNDDEGKYFVRPPKTQWEIALDIKCEQMKKDSPF